MSLPKKGPKLKPKPLWTELENWKASTQQGWAIFECGYAGDLAWDVPRLCRDDDSDAFADDCVAARFVVRTARTGNRLAKRALAFLRALHVEEYASTLLAAGEGPKHAERDDDMPEPDCTVTPCALCLARAAAIADGRCFDCENRLGCEEHSQTPETGAA